MSARRVGAARSLTIPFGTRDFCTTQTTSTISRGYPGHPYALAFCTARFSCTTERNPASPAVCCDGLHQQRAASTLACELHTMLRCRSRFSDPWRFSGADLRCLHLFLAMITPVALCGIVTRHFCVAFDDTQGDTSPVQLSFLI